jgi:hypothetical protein
VCHIESPLADGPHNLSLPDTWRLSFEPDYTTNQALGAMVSYTHTLKNTGNVSDTYALTWTSSQGWGDVRINFPASNTSFPVTLNMPVRVQAGDSVEIEVMVRVPTTETVRGLTDTTIVTATSLVDALLVDTVTDTTRTATSVYLPLVVRH